MNHQLNIDGSFQTLPEAYQCLEINNANIADGDVVAAFYAAYEKDEVGTSVRRRWSIKALETIAHSRQSQLLAFILTVVPHVTQHNVSLLATPPESPPARLISTEVIELESDNERTVTPASGLDCSMATPDSDDISLPSEESPSSVGSVSTSAGSTESDFDDHIGGKFWDGASWRCEECNDELVQGKCPNGDIIDPCRLCGRAFEGACPALCDNCHKELDAPCLECTNIDATGDEDSSEDCGMIWDELDDVWRCKDCLWEVEANGKDEGQCHCRVDSEAPGAQWFAYPIDLSLYDHYEPADSDSSGSDSTDSELNSEDEAFIEDDGPFRPEMLSCPGPVFLPDESQRTERSTTIEKDDLSAADSEHQYMDIE
ncbi:MAG: hypothetical protein Q9191_001623 [Dirinaria sp. TL-2023a]